jgi:hypothetical protein
MYQRRACKDKVLGTGHWKTNTTTQNDFLSFPGFQPQEPRHECDATLGTSLKHAYLHQARADGMILLPLRAVTVDEVLIMHETHFLRAEEGGRRKQNSA